MGQMTLPRGGCAYVDTCAVIYFVERIAPFYSASLPLWSALNAGQQAVATSALSLLEVLVKPIRDGNKALATLFRQFLLGTSGFDMLPISQVVLEEAANLRAVHGLKTPDAIHAATATRYQCGLFVTDDPIFRRVPGLNVVVLGDEASS